MLLAPRGSQRADRAPWPRWCWCCDYPSDPLGSVRHRDDEPDRPVDRADRLRPPSAVPLGALFFRLRGVARGHRVDVGGKAGVNLEWDRVAGEFRRLASAAATLNSEIAAGALLGPQYEVGHTYLLDVVAFLKDDLGPRPRNRKTFLWSKDGARRPLEQVWQLSLYHRSYTSTCQGLRRPRERASCRSCRRPS